MTLTIAAGTAPGARAVVLAGDSAAIPFADNRASQLTVATGVPAIESIDPIVLRPGDARTLTIRGQHLGRAQAVTATPAAGVFIDPAYTISADGTVLTTRIGVTSDAPFTDEGVIRVLTPGGVSSAERSPANGFRIVH